MKKGEETIAGNRNGAQEKLLKIKIPSSEGNPRDREIQLEETVIGQPDGKASPMWGWRGNAAQTGAIFYQPRSKRGRQGKLKEVTS